MADPTKILALVLAGGEGSRLRPLTVNHCKPSLRIVNDIRIVDFVLANLVNSGIDSICLLAQYKPGSLLKHLDSAWCNGRSGPERGIEVVLPDSSGDGSSFKGTADAVHRNIDLVQRHRPDLVAVFAADHVYRMDVRQMIDHHEARGADVSVAAVRVPIEEGRSFGIIAATADGRIEEFQEKPQHPRAVAGEPGVAYASMGNYLFRTAALVDLLERMVRRQGVDFGHDMMPLLPSSGYRACAYDFSANRIPGLRSHEDAAYWRDVGTLDSLAKAREDMLGAYPRLDLHNGSWPIRRDIGLGCSDRTAALPADVDLHRPPRTAAYA